MLHRTAQFEFLPSGLVISSNISTYNNSRTFLNIESVSSDSSCSEDENLHQLTCVLPKCAVGTERRPAPIDAAAQ